MDQKPIQKGTLCKLRNVVSGGKPLVTVKAGSPVLVIKRYSRDFVRVYAGSEGAKLTVSEQQLEVIER